MSDDHAHLVRLLSERWVLALSTVAPEGPYTTPLYYALDAEGSVANGRGPRLLFVSDPETNHGRMLGDGPTRVSAATYLESREVSELRGVQLRGEASRLRPGDSEALARARALYLDAHPVARPAFDSSSPPALYVVEIFWAKLTDNRLGFGTHRVVSYARGTTDGAT